MSEVEIALYQQILIGAGVVFALGWLSVAFLTAGRARAVAEWISVVAMYAAVLSLTAHQLQRVWLDGRRSMIGLFAFLSFVFASGLVVSGVRLVRALAGRDGGSAKDPTAPPVT